MTVEGPPKDTAFVQGICEDDKALPQSTSTLMSSSSAPSTAPPVHDDPSSTADNAGFSHPTATVASDGENLRRKNKRASMIALVVGVVLVAVAVVAPCVVLSKRNKNYVDNDPTGTNNGPTGTENQTGGGVTSSSFSSSSLRIIGGEEASEDRYSYAVSLQGFFGAHYCGGSLIARDVVLTAAHCRYGYGGKVVLGRHDLDKWYDGSDFSVREELPHPEYSESSMDNDFMLVFLQEAVTASEGVVTVKLNSDPSVPTAGQGATIVGWGDTNESEYYSDISDVLMQAELSVISNDECSDSSGTFAGNSYSYNDLITESMLCAKAAGRDSCQGDSGGPLVMIGGGGGSDLQIGVVSWGFGCASDQFPGIYSRVSRVYDWIRDEVCNGSEYAPEAGFECGGGDGSISTSVPQIPTAYPSADPAAPLNFDPPTYLPTNQLINPPILTTSDNSCIICPYGATEDASVPYTDEAGNQLTCAQIIDAATAYEIGSDDCAYMESLVLEQYCCPVDMTTDGDNFGDFWDFVTGLFDGGRA
jgi:hypothetical protein